MRRISRPVRAVAVLGAVALLATACSGDDEGAPDDGGTTTTDGASTSDGDGTDGRAGGGEVSTFLTEPETLFPTDANESEGIAVLRAVFKGLVDYRPRTTEPFDQVAASIETDDNQTYDITLEDGWTFHNGEAVTAQSFVDAWNYGAYGPNAQQNSNFYAPITGYDDLQCGTVTETDDEGEEQEVADCENQPPAAEEMSGLTVEDELSFTVELENPDPTFPLQLGYAAFYPLPEVAFEDPEAFSEQPVGNGPFEVVEPWAHNEQIRTEAYGDYAGTDPAQIDALVFQIYSGDNAVNTAFNDLLAGNLDIHDELPPERIPEAQQQLDVGESNSSVFNYLGFPMYLEMFEGEDGRLRRHALSQAINREIIAETVLGGAFEPADSVVSPVIPGYESGVCPNWEHRPEEAAQKWEEAGDLDGTITVWFNSGSIHDQWIEAAANQWSETLGIPSENIEFESLPFPQYLPRADNGELTGPFRLGWGMDYPSPQNYLEPLYTSAAVPPGGANNFFYENDEFDRLIEQGNAENTLEEAIPHYQDAVDVLCEDSPVAPVFFNQNQYASSERVQNVFVDAFGDVDYTGLTVSE